MVQFQYLWKNAVTLNPLTLLPHIYDGMKQFTTPVVCYYNTIK